MNRWVRVLFLRLLVLPTLCALVVGVGLRYWFGIQDPQVTIPSPTMPENNGFAMLANAGEMVRADQKAIESLLDSKVAAYRNATMKDLLRRHARTLSLTRKALDRECRMPSLRSWNDICLYYGDFRTLAKLMILEGNYIRTNGGTADDAARKYLDVIRLGEKVSHGGPLIGRLVSIAITTIGQNALYPLAHEVTPAMARKVIATVKECQKNRSPFADTLIEEKYGMQAGILEIFQHPERFVDKEEEGKFQCDEFTALRGMPLAYLIWGKRTMFDNVTRQMDLTIAQAKQPYRADAPTIEPADDPISQYVFPVFSQARFKDVLVQTQDELLIAQFATEAYRAEKKALPGKLGELVTASRYAPVDPFADGKPLAYRGFLGSRNGVCSIYYHWYSVGPDRKNDEADPCENTDAPGRGANRYRVGPSSKGDIVPGVNVLPLAQSQNTR